MGRLLARFRLRNRGGHVRNRRLVAATLENIQAIVAQSSRACEGPATHLADSARKNASELFGINFDNSASTIPLGARRES